MGLLDDHLGRADPGSRGSALKQAELRRAMEDEERRRIAGWTNALELAEGALGSDLLRAASALGRAAIPFDLPADRLSGVRVGMRRSGCWVLYRRSWSGERGSGSEPVVGMDARGRIFWVLKTSAASPPTYLASRDVRNTKKHQFEPAPSPDHIASGLAGLLSRHDVQL